MVNERKLSKAELSKREDIIMNMKDNKRDLVKKYGKDAEAVMYGRATNMAKKQTKEMRDPKLTELIKDALKNPKKADLNKDGKLSDYEKKRGSAIEKNINEENIGLADIGEMGYAAGEAAFEEIKGRFRNKPDHKAYREGFFQGFTDNASSYGLNEGKLLKEDLTITGEYEGKPVINSGDELEEYLIDIMSQAIGAKDFARKVAFGLTDETSSLSLEDQRKLIQFYLDNKQHFGSQGKSSPLPSSDYEKVVDGLRARKIPSRVKLEEDGTINIELGFDFPDSLANKVFNMLDELGVEADIMAETSAKGIKSERINGGPRRDYRREDRDDGDGQDEEWYSESIDDSESYFTGQVDQIAQAEFGMNYDQLGPGEKEWVRDEIDNMTFEGQVNEVSTHLSEAKTPEELIKVSDELEKFINDISDDIDQEDLDKLSDVLTTVRGNIKNMLKK